MSIIRFSYIFDCVDCFFLKNLNFHNPTFCCHPSTVLNSRGHWADRVSSGSVAPTSSPDTLSGLIVPSFSHQHRPSPTSPVWEGFRSNYTSVLRTEPTTLRQNVLFLLFQRVTLPKLFFKLDAFQCFNLFLNLLGLNQHRSIHSFSIFALAFCIQFFYKSVLAFTTTNRKFGLEEEQECCLAQVGRVATLAPAVWKLLSQVPTTDLASM